MSKALDYASRMAIAGVVAEELRAAASSLQLAMPQARQLHGPCSIAAEEFVLGSVLCSPQPPIAARGIAISKRRRAREREQGPHCPPQALGLQPSDFWARSSQLYFEAMLAAPDPTDIPAMVEWLWSRERITGPHEHYAAELEGYRARAALQAALFDVAGACVVILEHARSRRLVELLARLADGICHGEESHHSAQLALREHFVTERGTVVRP